MADTVKHTEEAAPAESQSPDVPEPAPSPVSSEDEKPFQPYVLVGYTIDSSLVNPYRRSPIRFDKKALIISERGNGIDGADLAFEYLRGIPEREAVRQLSSDPTISSRVWGNEPNLGVYWKRVLNEGADHPHICALYCVLRERTSQNTMHQFAEIPIDAVKCQVPRTDVQKAVDDAKKKVCLV